MYNKIKSSDSNMDSDIMMAYFVAVSINSIHYDNHLMNDGLMNDVRYFLTDLLVMAMISSYQNVSLSMFLVISHFITLSFAQPKLVSSSNSSHLTC